MQNELIDIIEKIQKLQFVRKNNSSTRKKRSSTKKTEISQDKTEIPLKKRKVLIPKKKREVSQEKLSLARINQFNTVVWKTYEAWQKITDINILQTFEENIDNDNVNNGIKVQFLDTLIKYYDSVWISKKAKKLAKKYISIIEANPIIEYNKEDYKFAKNIIWNT